MIDILYNNPKIINNISEGIFKNEEDNIAFPSCFIPLIVETHSAAHCTPLLTTPKISKKIVIFS